jgi:hypothetical protein
MLSEFMVGLEPGRKAVLIAGYGVMARTVPVEILKMNTIRENIRKHVEKGYPLPKIAEGLWEE